MSTTQQQQPLPLEYRTSPAQQRINPWLFVPVLYFMQAIPNILATETFVSIYKDLGIDNRRITFWTSMVGLPWALKLLWGPFVDLNFTKRQWTVAMQVLLAGALAFAAGVIHLPGFLPLSVAALFLIAFLSATHDIACDGLYLMSLDKQRQAAFSGVMATCSRLGRMFVSFLLLYIAGKLQSYGYSKGATWSVGLGMVAAVYAVGMLWNTFTLPRPADDVPAVHATPGENQRNILRTLLVFVAGVCGYFLISAVMQIAGHGIATSLADTSAGALVARWHLDSRDLKNQLEIAGGTLVALIPLLLLIRKAVAGSPMGDAFATYFKQSGIAAILAFLVFYRFGEAMILKIIPLFFLGKPAEGGMGLSVETLGKVYGISLPIGLILGGLAGGAVISRLGLRRAFWPLVLCMHAPNLLYVWVAFVRPATPYLYGVAFTEAFGYGFGFAGYFVYLMYVAQRGNFRTSHYAIGTGLGALFITFAGILSGILQQALGYKGFFVAACLFTVPGTLTLLFIPMENDQTRSVKAASDH